MSTRPLIWSRTKATLPAHTEHPPAEAEGVEPEPIDWPGLSVNGLRMVAGVDGRVAFKDGRARVKWAAPLVSIDRSSKKLARVTVLVDGEPVVLDVINDCGCGG